MSAQFGDLKEYMKAKFGDSSLSLRTNKTSSWAINRKIYSFSILCVLLSTFLVLSPEAKAVSVFGKHLAKAYADDFFQFFRFRVVGVSITKDGFMEIIFKPPKRNPSRTSVKLRVVLTKDGSIKRMNLSLNRAFINDAKQGMFARDVAKSFLQAGVHKDDYEKIRPVVNEIFFRQKLTPIVIGEGKSKDGSKLVKGISIFKLGEGKLTSGDIIIIGDGGSIPKLPVEFSSPYKCFTGSIDHAKVDLSKTTILFKNTTNKGHKSLNITIGSNNNDYSNNSANLDFHSLPLYVP